jgi:curved DNA-binding protein
MDFKDYYQTLGLGKTASSKEIKQAYRRLARKFHPDVNPGDKAAEARFKEINEAYEVLGDPEKRKKYDELGANWRQYEQAQQSGQSPFGDMRWTTGQSGGGFRTINEDELRDMFGGENPFSDFFQAFFGGGQRPEGRRGRSSRTARTRTGRDVEEEIELSLEEAMQGAMRRLAIKHEGHTRTVDVRIPPGVGDGSRVRVPGEGEHAQAAGRAGDLYLKVRLRQDPRFERRGRDLHTQITIPVTVAVLGGEADVPALGERPLRLKIPGTTQNGQVFRLKGHGMPAVGKPADRGDLYATVTVTLPRHLTAEQRRHYEELAKLEGGAGGTRRQGES